MGFHGANEIGVRQFVCDFHTDNCAKRMALPTTKRTVSGGNCRNKAISPTTWVEGPGRQLLVKWRFFANSER